MASIRDVEADSARQNEPYALTILQLDGEPYRGLDSEPATISVVGGESERVRRWEEQQRERLRSGIHSGTEHARRVDRVVAACTDWSGWDDGEADLPFTEANVRALLGAPGAQHILRQVETAVTAHGVFSKGSSGP